MAKAKQGALDDHTTATEIENISDALRAAALIFRAVLKQELNDDVGALADYTAAIETKDATPADHAWALVGRATLRKRQGENDLAVADCETVIGMENIPRIYLVHATLLRGSIRSEKEDLTGAMADYSAVIDMDLESDFFFRMAALGGRACVHYKLNEFDKAVADCEQALRLDSTQTWIRANLGHALLRLGRVDEAKVEYERALRELDSVEKLDKHIMVDVNKSLAEQPDLAGAREILEMAEKRKAEM